MFLQSGSWPGHVSGATVQLELEALDSENRQPSWSSSEIFTGTVRSNRLPGYCKPRACPCQRSPGRLGCHPSLGIACRSLGARPPSQGRVSLLAGGPWQVSLPWAGIGHVTTLWMSPQRRRSPMLTTTTRLARAQTVKRRMQLPIFFGKCDISRFFPRIDLIFSWKALYPFFGAQDEGFLEFRSR